MRQLKDWETYLKKALDEDFFNFILAPVESNIASSEKILDQTQNTTQLEEIRKQKNTAILLYLMDRQYDSKFDMASSNLDGAMKIYFALGTLLSILATAFSAQNLFLFMNSFATGTVWSGIDSAGGLIGGIRAIEKSKYSLADKNSKKIFAALNII